MNDLARNPCKVRCTKCGHHWIGLYLPILIDDAAKIMKNLTCPMCAAGANKIVIAQ